MGAPMIPVPMKATPSFSEFALALDWADTTLNDSEGERGLCRLRHNRIFEHPKLFDLDAYDVAHTQKARGGHCRTDSGWRARRKDIARLEREDGRQLRNHF